MPLVAGPVSSLIANLIFSAIMAGTDIMNLFVDCMAVGFGGFLGAISRMLLGMGVLRYVGGRLPYGTILINILGCFLLGGILSVAEHRLPLSDTAKLAVATGFIGAFTTFSTYIYESHQLATQGAWIAMAANLFGSIAMGLIAVKLGVLLGQWL